MPYIKRMQQTLKITAKGQITLNKGAMQHLGARPGDRVDVQMLPGGALRLVPPRKKTWAEVAGMLYEPGMPVLTIEEMDEAIGQSVSELDRRSRY